MLYESKTRSMVKSIVWRIIAALLTWVILYLYTGQFSESAERTVIVSVVVMIAYYIHERVWNNVNWGKEEKSKF